MTNPITGEPDPPAIPSLAEAMAQRQAMQKVLWAGALGPLRSALDKLVAAELPGVGQELQTVLPYLPDGQLKMALTNLSNIIGAAPQVVRDAIAQAERETA